MPLSQFINHFSQSLLIPFREFFYPPYCITCDVRLSKDEARICKTCWNSFSTLDKNDELYRKTKQRFAEDGNIQDCHSPYSFEKEGNLQKVIHSLKYEGFTSLGILLGKEIGKTILNDEAYAQADVLVPIPLHHLKQRERGYNQSEYICKGISSVTNIPVTASILKRTKYTQSQTQLDLNERQENVSQAFMVTQKNRVRVRGKTIILVDDVITTGATMRSCAKELRNYGVGKVLSASIGLA